jgi:hypothetical protein
MKEAISSGSRRKPEVRWAGRYWDDYASRCYTGWDLAPRWVPHTEGCMCFACRARRSRLEREAAIERRVIVWADVPREHVLELLSKGMRKIDIARRAGVSPALITKVLKPGTSMNEATAERILAVEATSAGGLTGG